MTVKITGSAIDEDRKLDAVSQRRAVLIAPNVPREFDEHEVKSGRDAHRQCSIDDVVRYQMRTEPVSAVEYLERAAHVRLLVHLQHIQRYTLSKICLEPLQTNGVIITRIQDKANHQFPYFIQIYARAPGMYVSMYVRINVGNAYHQHNVHKLLLHGSARNHFSTGGGGVLRSKIKFYHVTLYVEFQPTP